MIEEQRPPVSPVLAILFGILAVSTAAIFIRYAQREVPSLVIAAYRLTIASLVLAPFALGRSRQELRRLGGRELALAILSGVFLSIHFATWITSLEYTTVASSVVLVSTAPLWVVLLSPLAIREPLTRPVLAGMGLALLGGVVIGLNDACALQSGRVVCPTLSELLGGKAILGDGLALAGALMGAGYLLIGRSLRRKVSLLSYVFIVYSIAAIGLLLLVAATGEPMLGYTPVAYLWFVLLALVPQILGHSTFNWALRYLSAAYVSITLLGEPVGSTILAYLLLNEAPGELKMIGAILILAGIYIASHNATPG